MAEMIRFARHRDVLTAAETEEEYSLAEAAEQINTALRLGLEGMKRVRAALDRLEALEARIEVMETEAANWRASARNRLVLP